ncbi:type 1 glutamine amidotransferase domain-containing protein [Arthrobacter oryzae]|uniref:type 1 glutamine amidotransferase domain-containing protein n=1 Tax=Arthrobacter oryzae TaxID=409290 RepID=UPI002859C8AF|nr:type 1 glutamine amidotransferase domain-containing protein [Arthrobacter oryzae]MDR6508616.1 putative intracellular protease/amidase [Arthrobacter oryzae]
MSRILMVVSAADSLVLADGTQHPTGFWAEELVVAHQALKVSGADITIATPGGKQPTIDPASLHPGVVGSEEKVSEFKHYLTDIAGELEKPKALASVNVADFDAVVLPGGHGPMADLATDADLGALLIQANDAGIIIAPFCHGPAGLLSATTKDGIFAFAGRQLTVFTDEEELTGGTGEATPWLVATTLAERGAIVKAGPAWSSYVVRDDNLISGQNPQSSEAVAAAVVSALAE